MRTKLSKILARRNHHNSSNSSLGISTYKNKTKKISAISRFILPNNIRSIIRNTLTSKKKSTSSNKSKDDCSEEVDAEKNTNESSPESIVKRENSFSADKQPAGEAFSGFLIKKLKRATSGNMARVHRFRSNSFRRARSTGKEMDETEAEKTEIGEELCKKRILMGGKCRPLHVSGALHYDHNGILLPEEILSPLH